MALHKIDGARRSRRINGQWFPYPNYFNVDHVRPNYMPVLQGPGSTPTLAQQRGSFLLMVRQNHQGIANTFYKALQANPNALTNIWSQYGGDPTELIQAVDQGNSVAPVDITNAGDMPVTSAAPAKMGAPSLPTAALSASAAAAWAQQAIQSIIVTLTNSGGNNGKTVGYTATSNSPTTNGVPITWNVNGPWAVNSGILLGYLADIAQGRTLSSGTYAGNASPLSGVYSNFQEWGTWNWLPQPGSVAQPPTTVQQIANAAAPILNGLGAAAGVPGLGTTVASLANGMGTGAPGNLPTNVPGQTVPVAVVSTFPTIPVVVGGGILLLAGLFFAFKD